MDLKLNDILNNNSQWPLIIEGGSSNDFPSPVIIPATTPSSELGLIPSEHGLKYPFWAMEIKLKAQKSKKIIVCIDNLDAIPLEEQEKFYGMIKYKGVNGFKFPENAQIIITVSNANKISKRLANLCLIVKKEK